MLFINESEAPKGSPQYTMRVIGTPKQESLIFGNPHMCCSQIYGPLLVIYEIKALNF